MSFLSKHYPKIVVGAIAVACIAAAGIVVLKSKADYDTYLKEYEKNAEEIKASFPALPEKVEFDNEYVSYDAAGENVASTKSSFKGSLILYARDAKVAPLSESKKQEYKTMPNDDSKLAEYITGLPLASDVARSETYWPGSSASAASAKRMMCREGMSLFSSIAKAAFNPV